MTNTAKLSVPLVTDTVIETEWMTEYTPDQWDFANHKPKETKGSGEMVKKIVITEGNGWYKDRVGEVFNVMERDLSGNRPEDDHYYVEHPGNDVGTTYFVRKDNCVVLKTEPAANLDVLDLIANLTRRVSELERAVKQFGIEKAAEEIDKAVVKKRQLTRDEIVRRAIKDVAEIKAKLCGDFPWDYDIVMENGHQRVEFVINRDKRTVVALSRNAYVDKETVNARGIAKCAPNDVFNAHIGKAIALRRALGLEVPAEYLNAPQPKEPRVGDVVRWSYIRENDSEIRRVERVEDDKYWLDDGGWDVQSTLTVIDDTVSTERAAQEASRTA